MSDIYTLMKDKFEKGSSDAQCVLEDQACLFENCNVDADEVASSLFASTDEDPIVQELLQLLFKSFAVTIQRLLIDHLPGGQYHGVTDPKIIQETISVPKTNMNPERDFAIGFYLKNLTAPSLLSSHCYYSPKIKHLTGCTQSL